MSRTKNTGETIAFRLPPELDRRFRKRAKAEGLSPGELARKIALLHIFHIVACIIAL